MSINNLQQTLHNRQYAIYNYQMQTYDADKFADWLTAAFTRSRFKSFSALADDAKVSRSTVSALAGAKKQPLTDKPSQPKASTVISLAKSLGENLDEALLIGGHAPINQTMPFPPEIEETMQNLSFKVSDADRAEIVKEVSFAYEVALRRLEDRKKREAQSSN